MARGKHSADRSYFKEQYYEEKDNNNLSEDINEDEDENDQEYEDYYDEPKLSKIKVVSVILIVLCVIIVALYITMGGKNNETKEVASTNTLQSDNKLVSTYEGYKVLGKIKIEKNGVEQYILDSKEDNALKKGVIKIYGGSLNSYGNFCLAGHNYDNIFGKLNELDIKDKIIIVDKNLSETRYLVKEILSVEPTDLSVLVSNNEKKELTLITCENASTKRLVIKAEEE